MASDVGGLLPPLPAAFDDRTDLVDSAPLMYHLAQRHCDSSCRHYHALWQYLRCWGINSTLATSAAFLVAAFRRCARAGMTRVLISASADYGLLALVHRAYGWEGVTPQETLVDRCPTPLAINRWYSDRHGVTLETRQSDILAFTAAEPFDVICCHSFLGYFPQTQRQELVRRWYEFLAPGGRVITCQRIRPGFAPDAVVRHSAAQGETLRRQLMAHWHGELGLERHGLAQAALGYARGVKSYAIPTASLLGEPFEAAGFVVEQLTAEAAGDDRPTLRDIPGTGRRLQLCARRPKA
ncbi:MAG: class I SAM-dependent methyltransferase [Candidatus Competibacterales bacterium]